MMLLISWSIFDVSCHLWPTSHVSKKTSCSCGNSSGGSQVSQLRIRHIGLTWLPPACRDEELTAEFDRAGPEPDGSWVYYTDLGKSGTYSIDEIAALADRPIYYYNTKEWHIAHCTYNRGKAVRAPFTGVTVELRAEPEGHVKHCEAMIRNHYPLDAVVVVSAVTLDADWEVLRKMHPMHPENSAVMYPGAMHHDSMHPDSMHPESMHPDSMHPESMHPDSMYRDSMHLESMHPDGMHPNRMHPNRMHPNSMHPNSKH